MLKRVPGISILEKMPNEALRLKTVNLSADMEEICRNVYGEFLRRFDLQGKWQLIVRAADPDRVFIQSIAPTGNSDHLETISPEAQLASDLSHHLNAHYRRYRDELPNSE
jgi:hypothetical protein